MKATRLARIRECGFVSRHRLFSGSICVTEPDNRAVENETGSQITVTERNFRGKSFPSKRKGNSTWTGLAPANGFEHKSEFKNLHVAALSR